MEKSVIAVVGAGPAGIGIGVEAFHAVFPRPIILEKEDHYCNTIVSLYREGKQVDSVYRKVVVAPQGALSFTTMSRESFLSWVEGIIQENDLDIRYGHEVLEVRKENDYFVVRCSNDVFITAPMVVIAIGIFGRPVKPSYPIPAEVRKRVYFSLPSEPPQKKNLLVVGGGDSAAEAACFLSRTNRVTLSYRRSEFFRINEPNLCTLDQCCTFENLATRLGVDITGIHSEDELVAVSYTDGEKISYDAIFYFLGGSTPRAFLEKCGIAYSGNVPIMDAYGESNVSGLFLAGDLAAEKGTIMTAFNSAAAVVQRIAEKYPKHLKNRQ